MLLVAMEKLILTDVVWGLVAILHRKWNVDEPEVSSGNRKKVISVIRWRPRTKKFLNLINEKWKAFKRWNQFNQCQQQGFTDSSVWSAILYIRTDKLFLSGWLVNPCEQQRHKAHIEQFNLNVELQRATRTCTFNISTTIPDCDTCRNWCRSWLGVASHIGKIYAAYNMLAIEYLLKNKRI